VYSHRNVPSTLSQKVSSLDLRGKKKAEIKEKKREADFQDFKERRDLISFLYLLLQEH
jgi:hypothetical protein